MSKFLSLRDSHVTPVPNFYFPSGCEPRRNSLSVSEPRLKRFAAIFRTSNWGARHYAASSLSLPSAESHDAPHKRRKAHILVGSCNILIMGYFRERPPICPHQSRLQSPKQHQGQSKAKRQTLFSEFKYTRTTSLSMQVRRALSLELVSCSERRRGRRGPVSR